MTKATQGKDGRFTGSIGTGKTQVPTSAAAALPSVRSTPLSEERPDYARQHQLLTATRAAARTADDTRPLGEAGTWSCPRCAATRLPRGVVHTCPAPGLLVLTPATEEVLEACREAGGTPLLVGGAVRDALLCEARGETPAPKDVDIEVYGADTETLAAALRRTGARVDEVGVSFGVLKVLRDGEEFDVSLPRTETKTGAGHRGFDVSPDHTLDYPTAFGRRDFTINAVGWDPSTGDLIDCYGGVQDLHDGVLRHTSAAFGEDPLRVLRGAGFAARFGFDMAPETVEECRLLSPAFSELATERVWTEWEKIASRGSSPSKALDLIHQVEWERHFPALAAIRGVEQDPTHHPEGTVEVHTALTADAAARIAGRDNLPVHERTILVLAAISHDLGKSTHTQHQPDGRITSHGHAQASAEASRGFLDGIGAPQRVREHVAALAAEHMTATNGSDQPSAAAVRRLARRLAGSAGNGPDLQQWARVVEADNAGRGPGSRPSPAAAWLEAASRLPDSGKPAPSLLRGEHLIARGLRPGPSFAPILAAALAAQDNGDIHDVPSALAWLDAHLADQ